MSTAVRLRRFWATLLDWLSGPMPPAPLGIDDYLVPITYGEPLQLEPYREPGACAKCGGEHWTKVYREAGLIGSPCNLSHRRPRPESITWACGECGFKHVTATLDASEFPAPKVSA